MPATRRVGLGSDAEFASSDAERGCVSERTGKENGVCMSAVSLDDKVGLVLIDLHNGILGLLIAVPPDEIVREQRRRKRACPACPVGW